MKRVILCLVAAVLIVGCTTTQKGATVGSAVGAGLGAIIGHQSGSTAKGAAVGAAAGGLAGALIGEQMATKFCPVCGTMYTEDIQFCSREGAELKYKQK